MSPCGLPGKSRTSTRLRAATATTTSPKEVGRTGEFALYNEFDPRRKILLNADRTASTTGTGLPRLLDLNAGEKDGNDVLFGDLGNNRVVAGTSQNDLYGGFGNDLFDARSSQDIDGGLNDMPNTVNITNRAYGGAGKDVLIADTAADRLDRLGGQLRHLHRTVRAVGHAHGEPHRAAAAAAVPLCPVAERWGRLDVGRRLRYRPDAQWRAGGRIGIGVAA